MAEPNSFTLYVILAITLAIVYALRYVVVMERRIARIELHIEKIAKAVLREEKSIRSTLGKRR